MKVLVVASILPVPKILPENDYVLTLANNIKYNDRSIEYIFCRPSPYFPFLNRGKWSIKKVVSKLKNYIFDDKTIHILPYAGIASSSFWFAITSIFFVLSNLKRIKKLKSNIDLCHAHFIFPDGMMAYYLKRKYKIPYLITVHNEQRLFKSKLGEYFAKKVMKNASKLITVNPVMMNFIKSEIKMYHVEYIGHGLTPEYFTQKKRL